MGVIIVYLYGCTKITAKLLAGSITEPHGDIHDTIYGFDSSFSDDDVLEGN